MRKIRTNPRVSHVVREPAQGALVNWPSSRWDCRESYESQDDGTKLEELGSERQRALLQGCYSRGVRHVWDGSEDTCKCCAST